MKYCEYNNQTEYISDCEMYDDAVFFFLQNLYANPKNQGYVRYQKPIGKSRETLNEYLQELKYL